MDHPLGIWKRYVDDTFVIQDSQCKNKFLPHINSIDKTLQFTAENTRLDGTMPFLDITLTPMPEVTLTIGVYRKPIHTNQYLQWDSHHQIAIKDSVINTLMHRAKTVCSTPELFKKEIQHLKGALSKCKYPRRTFNRINNRNQKHIPNATNNRKPTKMYESHGHIIYTVPGGSIKTICNK